MLTFCYKQRTKTLSNGHDFFSHHPYKAERVSQTPPVLWSLHNNDLLIKEYFYLWDACVMRILCLYAYKGDEAKLCLLGFDFCQIRGRKIRHVAYRPRGSTLLVWPFLGRAVKRVSLSPVFARLTNRRAQSCNAL